MLVAVVAVGLVGCASLPHHESLSQRDRLQHLCERHDVPLKAAALQFPLRHPSVRCVLAGARSSDEVRENIQMMQHTIADSFWEALDA